MAIRMKVDIVGLEDAVNKINRFDFKTTTAVRGQVRKSALRLGRKIRAKAPVGDTGNLKKSIRTRFSKDELSADVGPTKGKGSHAHLIEFGHRLVTTDGRSIGHVPAHPFITPAAEEERPKYISDMKQAIQGAVRK